MANYVVGKMPASAASSDCDAAELGSQAEEEPLYRTTVVQASTLRDRRSAGAAAGTISLMLVGAAAFVVARRGASGPTAARGADVSMLDAAACSSTGEDCRSTKCCADAGTQCYEQDAQFAMCRPSCTPGPDPVFDNGRPWSCAELGQRTAGEYKCGKPGEDCRTSKCCADPGMQCYSKNASWATCKAECVAGGPDLTDMDSTPWMCKELGQRTASTKPWVQEECKSGWDTCTDKRCCKVAGEQCYLQNDYFGECKALNACNTPGWSCNTVGSRTPLPPPKGGKLAPWVQKTCAKENEGCLKSKCCAGMELQCYEKNSGWAQCLSSCTPGAHADDKNASWSCKPLGPRSYGLAVKGSPSLYCFSVIRIQGYEAGLLASQKAKGAGIFACDDFAILSADGTTTVAEVTTISFPGAPIVTSIDGTAGNTFLFVNAWNKLMELGIWRQHAFTVKVDPDAVFFAERLRWHMEPYTGQKVFVINCHRGDMIYGALEVYSFSAIQAWAAAGKTCNTPNNYGEDKYMTQCMDHLGVARVHDEAVLGDKLCNTFKGCGMGWNAAFHPFKDIGSWEGCYNEATKTTA